jgi:hypothetical protein
VIGCPPRFGRHSERSEESLFALAHSTSRFLVVPVNCTGTPRNDGIARGRSKFILSSEGQRHYGAASLPLLDTQFPLQYDAPNSLAFPTPRDAERGRPMRSTNIPNLSHANHRTPVFFGAFALLVAGAALLFSGCGIFGQKPAPAAPAQPAAAATPAPAPAAPAASAVAADGSSADTTAKLAAADWAIKQDAIKHDPNGEWAISATASSSYNDAQGQASWSPNQATGEPNVDNYADDGHAWTSKTPDGGIEWLDLTYPKPVYASEVRVRESCGSGAVIKIEVYDEGSVAHTVWAGNDPTTGLNYLMVKFNKTPYKTARVKVTLATNVIPGWNEIDAVQLVGTDQ